MSQFKGSGSILAHLQAIQSIESCFTVPGNGIPKFSWRGTHGKRMLLVDILGHHDSSS